MRFDDRLDTLLNAPVADARDRAVRWRQLVDLLSRLAEGERGEAVDQALELVRREGFAIDEQVRAATVRGIAGRRLITPLLRILAAQPVRIAAPLFAGLSMSPEEAADILADADADVRALVSVPAPRAEPEPVPEPDPEMIVETAAEVPVPSISDMVTRIERLKRTRTRPAPPPRAKRPRAAPRPKVGGEPRLFEWESDASGHIAWVEGAPRGALVGRPLGGDGVGLLERQAASRIGQRHPFVDVPLVIADALEGQWSATGVPAFDPGNGRFLGYRGLARRTDGAYATDVSIGSRLPDLDGLRELIHEIKTPLNAIIGFAEIIDGQYLGPAHVSYRHRAAEIVAQARQLLSATEDLDFAAKLRSSRASHSEGTEFVEIFPKLAEEMNLYAVSRGAGIVFSLEGSFHRCALDPELAGRLVRRFVKSVIDVAEQGETLALGVGPVEGMCGVNLARPRAVRGTSDEQMVDPTFAPGAHDQLGLGFALRLVRGLARIAGGDLRFETEHLLLLIPSKRSTA